LKYKIKEKIEKTKKKNQNEKTKTKNRERYFTVHTVQNTTVTYQRQLFRTHKTLSLQRNGIQSNFYFLLVLKEEEKEGVLASNVSFALPSLTKNK
jgi:predicted nucleotide-binding protein